MTKVAAIETKGLCIGYLLKGGKRKVVHEDLNLQLVSGEVTCLLGLNGAGKSTLLRTLCGFQPPLGGEIRLMGKPLSGYSQANFSAQTVKKSWKRPYRRSFRSFFSEKTEFPCRSFPIFFGFLLHKSKNP